MIQLPWKWIGVGLVAVFIAAAGYALVGSWESAIRSDQDAKWEKKLAEAALDQTAATQAIADSVDQAVAKRLAQLTLKQQPVLREIHRETRTLVDPRCDIPDGVRDNLNRLGTRRGTAPGSPGAPDATAPAA